MTKKVIVFTTISEVIFFLSGIIVGVAISTIVYKANFEKLTSDSLSGLKEIDVQYNSEDFNIKTIYSSIDYDNDGIDDYADILNGARLDANNHPFYLSKYYEGGYPPEDEGVCTDLIWRAFKNAGYSLKDMIDNDIFKYPKDYPKIDEPDPNIDFRRVSTQKVFFKKYGITLTNDYSKIEEWQPGDIVIFEDKHIGIISDIRTINGETYVIHNTGQAEREQEYLSTRQITGHYRFDASKVPKEILKKWQN